MEGIVPAKISAGVTFSKLVTLTAYPATSWALSVILRGPAAIDLSATSSGNQHQLTASATETGAYVAGLYAYSARVTNGDGDVVEVESGTVTVLPDLANQADGGDMRSHNRKVLDSVRAVIERRATIDQERYTINGRELWRTPLTDLLKFESIYAARVRQEEAQARGGNTLGQTIRMRLK